MQVLEYSGNEVVNAIYEAKLEEGIAEYERQKTGFIRHKYQVLKFFSKLAYQDFKNSQKEQTEDLLEAEKPVPVEDTSLQTNDAFLESMVGVLANVQDAQDFLDEPKESQDEPARGNRAQSFSYPPKLADEPTTSEPSRPSVRRRRSGRNIEILNSDNHDRDSERQQPKRRQPARTLDILEGDPPASGSTQKPMRRRRSARDFTMPDGEPLVSNQKSSRSPIRRRRSAQNLDLLKGGPLASKSDHERKPTRRTRSGSNSLAASSSPNLEISWDPSEFLESQNEGNNTDARKTKPPKERTKVSQENSTPSMQSQRQLTAPPPKTVKDIRKETPDKRTRNRKEHHRQDSDPLQTPGDHLQNGAATADDSELMLNSDVSTKDMLESLPGEVSKGVSKRLPRRQASSSSQRSQEGTSRPNGFSMSSSKLGADKGGKRSSTRNPRQGNVSRSRSSSKDVTSISFDEKQTFQSAEPENEGRTRRKRVARTRSSPNDLEPTSNLGETLFDGAGHKPVSQDAPRPPRSRQGGNGGRRERRSTNCYKSRREKMSSSMSNIRFDDFPVNLPDDEEEIDKSEDSVSAGDETPETNPPKESFDEDEKKSSGTMQKIKKGLVIGTKMTTSGVVKGAKMTTTGLVKGTKMTTTGLVKGTKMTTTGLVKGTKITKKATSGLVSGTIETIRKTRESLAVAEAQHEQSALTDARDAEPESVKAAAVAG